MKLGITFAFLSLIFAGINDIVFKKYSIKIRSKGMYIFGIGIVWTIIQFLYFNINNINLSFDLNSIVYGLITGLFLTISNILFIESLTHINISLGTTIYRLNTIGVVILSFIILNEPLGTNKLIGIISGLIAVLILYEINYNNSKTSIIKTFFLLVIAASLFRAIYGIISKIAILSNADINSMLIIISLSWIIGGAIYAIFRENIFDITKKICIYSMISGILVFLIVNFLMLAIKYGEASIVIPIANMSFILALLISIVLKMESISLRKIFSIFLAIISIILLSKI
ncbi:MAG TPA: EamA family transporter [Victivallales bacterium]|nr:EamA family transporter [Victivallales bacterium]